MLCFAWMLLNSRVLATHCLPFPLSPRYFHCPYLSAANWLLELLTWIATLVDISWVEPSLALEAPCYSFSVPGIEVGEVSHCCRVWVTWSLDCFFTHDHSFEWSALFLFEIQLCVPFHICCFYVCIYLYTLIYVLCITFLSYDF